MTAVDILVVDDSPADRASLRIAFEASRHPVRLHFAAGGRMALDMLRPAAGDRPALRPHLCLLDLKMPEVSGFEVLRRIKADPAIRDLPVIVYSGSDVDSDVAAAYGSQASGYVKKPSDAAGLAELADVIGRLATRILVFPER